MSTNLRRLASILVVAFIPSLGFGCAAAPNTEGSETGTSGDGDGDSGTQSGDGDGETQSGDGDGDGETQSGDGDGDGDGETQSGDGDGDGETQPGDGDGDTQPGDGDGDQGFACDWEVRDDGILMFEGESLPIVDSWEIANDVADAYGSGYIFWSGQSFNNQPGNGLMEVTLGIPEAGRYRVQWRTQIGMGDNPTEHNDIWLRFTDAADYYGKNGNEPESRRYPSPQCDDPEFIAAVEALPEVGEASCAAGSSSEGWMKVYSSGATEWKWSTRTSDNDAHDIYVEFDAPGPYTMQFSARADFMLLDRVVIHREDVDNALAQASEQPETPCP